MHSYSRRCDQQVVVNANWLSASANVDVQYPTPTLALDSVGDRMVSSESDGVLLISLQEANAVDGRALLDLEYACAVCTRLDPIEKEATMLMLKTRIDRILTWFLLSLCFCE